jgi:gamma-glutamylputrescine oxidase
MTEAHRAWGEAPWHIGAIATRPLVASSARGGADEVVVVGGGFTGLSAACHLARRGIRVVVLEAAKFGDGASGRTGGIVLEGTARGILPGSDACIASLERVVCEERIDCGLRLNGCWEIEHCGDERRDGALPWTDGELHIRVARTVAGGTVDPGALLTGLANAAARASAILHEHARVQRLTIGHSPVIEVDSISFKPRFAVVALNASMESLALNVRPVRSALTLALATERLDASIRRELGLAGIPFYTADLPYLWGREMADGRAIFGSGLVFGPPDQLEHLDVASGEAKAGFDRLEARVRGLHPALRDVRFSSRWAGPIAIPDRAIPILGRLPNAPSIIVAGGYSGHGVALSVRAGELVACAIIEKGQLPPWGATAR